MEVRKPRKNKEVLKMGFLKPNVEKMKAKKDVEGLIKALRHEGDFVYSYAADALGEIGDPRAVEPLIRAPYARYERKRALKRIGESAVEGLIKSLGYGDLRICEDAISVLGEIRDPRAVEPLIKLLGDEEKSVRLATVKALGKIGNPRAVGPLIKVFGEGHESSMVRKATARALKEFSTEGAKEAVKEYEEREREADKGKKGKKKVRVRSAATAEQLLEELVRSRVIFRL